MTQVKTKTFSVTKVFITTAVIISASAVIFAGMIAFFQDDIGTVESLFDETYLRRGVQGSLQHNADDLGSQFDDWNDTNGDLNTND